MKLTVGQTLHSVVDATTVVVVKAPEADVDVSVGGLPVSTDKQAAPTSDAAADQLGGTQIGKRYADEEVGIELLCSKAGSGTLAVNGTALPLKDAKPLPSSD